MVTEASSGHRGEQWSHRRVLFPGASSGHRGEYFLYVYFFNLIFNIFTLNRKQFFYSRVGIRRDFYKRFIFIKRHFFLHYSARNIYNFITCSKDTSIHNHLCTLHTAAQCIRAYTIICILYIQLHTVYEHTQSSVYFTYSCTQYLPSLEDTFFGGAGT